MSFRSVTGDLPFNGHIQWLKCHWTLGNAVPAPPIIDIQRSHTSNFIKSDQGPKPLFGGPKLTHSSLTSDFPL